jgi:hypothetical protein
MDDKAGCLPRQGSYDLTVEVTGHRVAVAVAEPHLDIPPECHRSVRVNLAPSGGQLHENARVYNAAEIFPFEHGIVQREGLWGSVQRISCSSGNQRLCGALLALPPPP